MTWKAAVKELTELDEISASLRSCGIKSEQFEQITWDVMRVERKRTVLDMKSGALRRRTAELRSRVYDLAHDDKNWEQLCEEADKLHALAEPVDIAAKAVTTVEKMSVNHQAADRHA